MRMIDADALKLKKVYCQERHELVVPVAEIDWMPTAYNQWIPVSERLPKRYDEVLITFAYDVGENYTGTTIDYLGCDNEWSLNSHPNVIAWMPLPEPYKESEEE